MFNQIRAVTELLGPYLSRGVRRIAPFSSTGTAEGLVNDLSEAEKVVFSLIEAGVVRRNQLDEVASALQATRLLKKFRYGGDPLARAKAAYVGFKDRNCEMLSAPEPSFLRKQLVARMRKHLAQALPAPLDGRHTSVFQSYRMRAGYASRCGLKDVIGNYCEWVPSSSMCWDPRFGTGAVKESTPFLRRWELVDGSIPTLEAVRQLDVHRLWSEVSASESSRAQVVPKDMSKDRLITIEPFVSTFLQHGVRRVMYESIHQGKLRWTAMDVMHLEDAQKINRRYALAGSRDSLTATIDLSDASDRIRWSDVQDVFPEWLMPLLGLCRSTHCEVDGESVELGMYAGMGNASTFVVESMIFWAAACAAMSLNGLQCSVCSVYGDDVVIDNASVPYVLEAFEALGWKVNKAKSFWGHNPFRESCGIWAFNGHKITPVRFDGYDLTTQGGLAGYSEVISHLLNSGLGINILMADRLMKQAGHLVECSNIEIPGSAVVHDKYGCWVHNYSRIRTRINRDTQLFEAQVLTSAPRVAEVPADRIGYLRGCLAGSIRTDARRDRNGQIKDHVVRYTVPYSTVTKKRWLEANLPVGARSRITPAGPDR